MRVRSTLMAAAAAAATLAAGLVAAPAAQAACVVKADLPATVSIDRPYKEITVPLRDSCGKDYAAFDLYGPSGWQDIFIYDGRYVSRDHWQVYDWDVTPGTYRTRDGDAWDASYDDLPVASDTTVAKYGARQTIKTSRHGSYVTVTGKTTRYSPSAETFIPRTTKVSLQRNVAGSWRYVNSLTPRAGTVSAHVHAPNTSKWRLVSRPTPTVWGSTSAVATR